MPCPGSQAGRAERTQQKIKLNMFPKDKILFLKSSLRGVPGWLSRLSIRLLISAQVTRDLTVRDTEPRIGLCADIVEPARDSFSLPLSAPPLLSQARALKINKIPPKRLPGKDFEHGLKRKSIRVSC